jgi:hypothetical protein
MNKRLTRHRSYALLQPIYVLPPLLAPDEAPIGSPPVAICRVGDTCTTSIAAITATKSGSADQHVTTEIVLNGQMQSLD